MTAGSRLATAVFAALIIVSSCSPRPADPASGETRSPTSSRSSSTSSSTSKPPPPPPEWRLATLPATTPTSVLHDVAAADATHAWAVGSDAYSPDEQYTSGVPIVLEWDGSRWSRAQLPAVSWQGSFRLVAAGSATDVWVVGGPMSRDFDENVTYVRRYDGETWREVPFPEGASPGPLSITDLSVVDGHAWLVGYRGAETKPAILEWNGKDWQEHQPPTECVRGGTSTGGMPNLCNMNAVKAFAADDVWAAGNGAWSGFLGPLLFHWDGATWQAVQVGLNQQKAALLAIDGSSASDMWAVGDNLRQGGGTLAVHGDGTTWQVVDGLPDKFLPGVAVDKTGSPWVLENTTAPSATLSTFAEGQWADTPAPTPPDSVGMTLNAIAAIPGTTRFIAVGAADLPTTPTTLQAVVLEYA